MKFTYTADAKPVDGYTIRRGIHRGGFGEVYYAVSDAGKEVALKLLTHDLETELRGIRQCLNLKHPNLVTIFDVRQDAEGDSWVIMEYVHGSSLEDVLAAFPMGLPISEVRDWMDGLFAGIDYLHDRGLVHRDLKPGNVYRENGVVKIGDVGLSKQMGGGRRQHTEAIGTVYYMAPEVAKGQYGVEVDVYSLGVMLYEMLTGRLPFDGETTGEILMKHLSVRPDLNAVPAAMRPVIAHALEKDPQKRTSSVKQFAAEFRRATAAEPLPESAFLPPPLPNGHRTASQQSERPTASAASRETPPRNRHHCQTPRSVVGAVLDEVLPAVRDRVRRELRRDVERQERKAHKIAERERKRQAKRERQAADHGGAWWIWVVLALLAWPMFTGHDRPPRWATVGILIGGFFAARHLLRSRRTIDPPVARTLAGAGSFPEQMAMSWLVSALAAGLLTVAGWQGMGLIEYSWQALAMQDVLHLGLVGFSGAAALVTMSQLESVVGGSIRRSRWLPAAVGAGVGSLAAGLDEFLMIRGFPGVHARTIFREIGPFDLWQNNHPTVAAYVVFFGATFALQDWSQWLDPYRTRRWRLGAVMWAALIAFLVSLFFGVPRQFALLSSVVISLTAQLAAPWQPRSEQAA